MLSQSSITSRLPTTHQFRQTTNHPPQLFCAFFDRPKTSGPGGSKSASSFQRNLMSSSLPKLPTRYASPTTNDTPLSPGGSGMGGGMGDSGKAPPLLPISAWGEDDRGSPARNSRKSSVALAQSMQQQTRYVCVSVTGRWLCSEHVA